jgi:hypothetical protein
MRMGSSSVVVIWAKATHVPADGRERASMPHRTESARHGIYRSRAADDNGERGGQLSVSKGVHMKHRNSARVLAALSLAAAMGMAHAIGVDDAKSDFLPTYAGAKGADLDVINSFVTYNPSTDSFVFSGTMNGDIGTTPKGFYVWGVDRGAGTPGFAPDGLPNILFDAVVVFNNDGTGRVLQLGPGATPTPLPAGSIFSAGSTIVGSVPGSLLPSTGFDKAHYTWNLWPRDGNLPMGFPQISDFAPDDHNTPVTVLGAGMPAPVPEPESYLLLAAGLGAIALRLRRRRSEEPGDLAHA